MTRNKKSDVMTTDLDLVHLLDAHRDLAKQAFEYEDTPRTAIPDNASSARDIAAQIRAAMDAHPDFAEQKSHFFLGKQLAFFNHHQAVNLLRVAVNLGGTRALEWYRRVLATTHTPMRIVAEVYGLSVKTAEQFSNGVKLLPFDELPDSTNSRAVKQFYIRPGQGVPAATAATIEVGEVKADEDSEKGHARFLELSSVMRKTVTAFVLSEQAAPTLGAAWQEFVDPEIEAAGFGMTWLSSRHEGRHSSYPTEMNDEMIQWVDKYLSLPLDVAAACDVPLARLNLARRRLSSFDKAIDGGVCLEALLSGKARGELTHRLSVRTALLLGAGLSDRLAIAEKIRKFYQLRSEAVHGSIDKKPELNLKITDDGLKLCLFALQAVIKSRRVPQPEVWELTGGPPGNRFIEDEGES
jgi:hypothetical protein